MIFDIILCTVLIGAFIIGTIRGFLRTIWGLCALIASIVLASILHPYAVDTFKNSVIAEKLNEHVYTTVKIKADDTAHEAIYTLPEEYVQDSVIKLPEISEDSITAATNTIVQTVISIAAGIFLFIVIRIALAIVYNILKVVFSFPILKQTNKIAGGIAQTVIALVIIYAALAVAAVMGTDKLNDTVICKKMYNNNILLTIVTPT